MKENKMPTSFIGRGEVSGRTFTKVRESLAAVIYQVVSSDGDKYWETWKKVWNRRFGVFSKPSSNGFGVWAWCYNDESKAIDKFNKINEDDNNRAKRRMDREQE